MTNPHTTTEQGDGYSLAGVKNTSEAFARRTVATHAQFILPHLRPGMRLLDCGCGPGTISVGLAKAIAPGQLVGVDIDSQHVEQARQHAMDEGLSNTQFETANVYQLPFDDQSFDAVFSHALMEHLAQPEQALAEMRRVLKPRGLIGLRTPDHDGRLLWPDTPDVCAAMEFVSRIIQSHDGDARRGKQFRARLVDAGFVDVFTSASYETYGTPERVQAWADFYAAGCHDPIFIARMEARGLADAATLAQYGQAWQAWAQQPGAFLATAWVEAVGTVAS